MHTYVSWHTPIDASRQGNKGLKYPRDKNEGTHICPARSGEGEKILLSGPGPELRLGSEKETGKKCEDNTRDQQKKKYENDGWMCVKRTYNTCP